MIYHMLTCVGVGAATMAMCGLGFVIVHEYGDVVAWVLFVVGLGFLGQLILALVHAG